MRICEVCGQEEEVENPEMIVMKSALIHVCENCRNDRQIQMIDAEK
ncbi:hypothetical protein [Neobacillus muris]|nr:hypothetical protein [Neobacillus muris]